MLNLVLICRGQMRAHGPMVARYNHPTFARGLFLVDPVLDMDTLLLAFLAQNVRVVVLAHAADVPDGVGWEHVRCAAGSVLSAATGNDFRVAVLQEVVIEGHVFWFREDRVIEF